MPVEQRNWRELCEAASTEYDSEKLIALVSEIVRTLDEKQSSRRPDDSRRCNVVRIGAMH